MAEKTTAAGVARIESEMTVRGPDFSVPMTLDGVVDFEQRRGSFTVDMGRIPELSATDQAGARRDAGFPLKMVQTPDQLFVSEGNFRRKAKADGKSWVMLDLEELDEEANLDLAGASQFSETNPEALLRFLKAAGGTRKTGKANIRGVPTTRYAGMIDLRRYPDMVPEDERDAARRTIALMTKQWGSPTQKVDVWVGDEDGMIYRERMPMTLKESGQTFKGAMVLDFLDVGRPQQIDLPDDDTVIDVTDQAVRHLDKG